MTSMGKGPSAARGAAAALAGLAIAELIAAAGGATSLLDGVSRVVVDTGPRQLVDAVVDAVGTRDKPVIRAAVGASLVGAGAAVARQPGWRRDAAIAGVAVAGAAAAARRPPRRPLAAAIAAGVGAATSRRVLRDERGALATARSIAAGAAVLAVSRRLRRRRLQDWDVAQRASAGGAHIVRDGAEGWVGAPTLLTPVEDFYVTDVNMEPPIIAPDQWRLAVGGLVDRPLELSAADLLGLPQQEFCAVMVCIHNPVGGRRVGNAIWQGVRLADVLALAGAADSATAVVTNAVDAYQITLPLALVRDELPAFVVTHMNGALLPAAHGGPARVFTPGLYGQYTGAKWLTALELTDEPRPDYWTRRGWPQQPMRVRPSARIDHPQPGARCDGSVVMAGVAWAPPHGVAGVEVRIDDGPWIQAEVAAEVSPLSWRRWRVTLQLPPGRHSAKVRALPRLGPPQDDISRPPFPTGATGQDTVTFVVDTPASGNTGPQPARQQGWIGEAPRP